MRHGSLFSGIGGFDLAAQWMGWENVFHCEWNKFGQQILKYYWPKAISYEDITKTDFTIHRGTIDILTGGFPCQPYSVAGQRKGKEDERHLWPEMLRAIREIAPRYVVGENVRGLLSWNGGMVFDEVCADLEALGYTVTAYIIPAVGVNAPHKRERIWFIAYANNTRGNSRLGQVQGENGKVPERNNDAEFGDSSSRSTQNTLLDGRLFGQPNEEGAEDGQFGDISSRNSIGICGAEVARTPTDTDATRCENWNKQHRGQSASSGTGEHCTCRYCVGVVTDTESRRSREIRDESQETRTRESNQPSTFICGISSATNTISIGGRKDERKREGESNVNDEIGSPRTWDKFPTQSPICVRNDGLSSILDGITFSRWRNESMKAGGNAIVPQVAYEIFKAIEKMNIR